MTDNQDRIEVAEEDKLDINDDTEPVADEINSDDEETNKKAIGSKSFCVIISILLSVSATLLLITWLNGGVLLTKHSRYGNLEKVYGLSEIIDYIDSEFYKETPSNEEMTKAAADAIVALLDDKYAQYFTAEEYAEYEKSFNKSYSGMGIAVSAPNEIGSLIATVYEDSPADKAGVKSGDIITEVNGKSVAGISLDELSEMLSGNLGDVISLTLMRGSGEIKADVTLGIVTVKTVHYKMLENDIGYVNIDSFSPNTPNEFDAAINELEGAKAFIFDVRGNPGGSLDSVLMTVNRVLKSGKIVSIGSSLDDPDLVTYAASDDEFIDVPMLVLIDGNSASASEIFASALQENGVAKLVGETTFGKGIVQTSTYIESTKGRLKITTDAYFTPNGNDIHGKGIAPDIKVEGNPEYEGVAVIDIPTGEDYQLKKAIDEISGQIK